MSHNIKDFVCVCVKGGITIYRSKAWREYDRNSSRHRGNWHQIDHPRGIPAGPADTEVEPGEKFVQFYCGQREKRPVGGRSIARGPDVPPNTYIACAIGAECFSQIFDTPFHWSTVTANQWPVISITRRRAFAGINRSNQRAP